MPIFLFVCVRARNRSHVHCHCPFHLLPLLSDIDIAQRVIPRPISEIASAAGVLPSELRPYGHAQAKLSLDILHRLRDAPNGKYILVTGVTPTPAGEGKSTTVIGLAQALGAHLKRRSFACVRQPSQGPMYGIKGGAAGGGYSQIIPMEEFNLHGTGDIHAITAANNLLAAALDTRMFHEQTQDDAALYRRLTDNLTNFTPIMQRRLRTLGIRPDCHPRELTAEERVRFARLDVAPDTISWCRVLDMEDRLLRTITVGEGAAEKGFTRQTGFHISVASEVMAILALTESLADLRERLGAIVVAHSRRDGGDVTAEDVGCAGAMTALMKDAIEPTLMQTLEHTPVLVHAGPFANIAHGNSSVLADRVALKLAGEDGFVLTEAGFGADMGGEKFFDIKCRSSGLVPDAAVVVCTVRCLKYHARDDGASTIASTTTTTTGTATTRDAREEGGCDDDSSHGTNRNKEVEAVRIGCANLVRHIQNMRRFGVPVVVAVNRFHTDTADELDMVRQVALQEGGAVDVVVSDHWARGGAGAVGLAQRLVQMTAGARPSLRLLYPDEMPLSAKIETICCEMYRAAEVNFSPEAKLKLTQWQERGLGHFPVCIAKTQYSFSANPALHGAPTGFAVSVRDVTVSMGARFVCAILGDISLMPGLPTRPAYFHIDIDPKTGRITGLS